MIAAQDQGSLRPASRSVCVGRSTVWAIAVAILSLCVAVSVAVLSWNQPLLEQHSFRQTQTAISAYWGIRDGWQFAYETPLFGAPWSMPFEFPVFQWIVSAVVTLTHLPLDTAGRLTSFLFHLGCAAVLGVFLRQLGVTRDGAILGGALFLLAPVNLFWGRSFLIESCALFFALAFLLILTASFRNDRHSSKYALLFCALLIGVVAAAVKITTFVVPAAVAVGVAAVTPRVPQSWRDVSEAVARSSLSLAVAGGALLISFAWYRFADQQKALNPFASLLTSKNLSHWNFGLLEDRFARGLWVETIIGRAVPESVGLLGTAAMVICSVILVRGRRLVLLAIFLCAFGAFFLLFPNLNQIHNYYQYAASVWLVAAAAIALGALSVKKPMLAIGLFVFIAVFQLASFNSRYMPSVVRSFSEASSRTLSLANAVREMTTREGVVMALGVGWSSEIAYYAERRFVYVLDEAGPAERFLETRNSLASPYTVEALLVCGQERWTQLALDQLTDTATYRNVGDCRLARFAR